MIRILILLRSLHATYCNKAEKKTFLESECTFPRTVQQGNEPLALLEKQDELRT